MAGDRETLFLLDDEPVMGGFNDAPNIEEPTEKEAPDKSIALDVDITAAVDVKKEEPDKDIASVEKKEPEIDTEQGDKAPETKAEIDPAERRWNETIAMLGKKDAQIETLVDQVRALTETVVRPKIEEAEPQPPQKPTFTNSVIDYRERLKEFTSEKEQAIAQMEQQKTVSNIQAIHQKDYADECEELPALTDPNIRQVFANIYYDPKVQFNTKPDGVFRAVRELKRQARERQIDLSAFAPAQQVKAQQAEAEKVKADESARKDRVAVSAMHTGGKQSTDVSTTLTSAQKDVARKFGLSDDVYAKTLAAMPRGGK